MQKSYWQQISELAPMILDRKHECDESCKHLPVSLYITTLGQGTMPTGKVVHADRDSAAHGIASGSHRPSTEEEIKTYKVAEEKSKKEQEIQAEREFQMYVRRPQIVDTYIEPATQKKGK
jgi:hypothetical protein